MVRREQRESGRVKLVPLANFTALIVHDVILDDDGDPSRRSSYTCFVIGDETESSTFNRPTARAFQLRQIVNFASF